VSIFSELRRRNVFRVAAAYAVVAWALTEVSDTVFPRLGLPDWTVTFVIVLLMLGFPMALFLSWAYELTPDGVRRTEDASPAEAVAGRTGRRLDRLIVVGALVIVALVGAERLWLAGRDAPQPALATPAGSAPSIAVLPFVNMSDDAANVFFSDGISEELLNLLAKIPELRVTSRSSSFSFRDQGLEIPEIAARLGVAHVLEGSVRKAGNRVRITVQLIDVGTDAHLWSGTYDRALHDIFAIQDEIAAAVVAQLKVTLLGEAPKVAATDPEAYALYLEGRHLGLLGTGEGYEHSRALLERALAIDPEYAAAWVDLARSYFNEIALGLRSREEGAALAHHALGDHAASDAALDTLIRSYGQEDPYAIATALAYRGEADRAFQWLARAVEAEDGGRTGTHVDPLLANLHADPRWLPFVESIGQAPHQLDAIEFNVTVPG
jgi:adenylate cyclase